MLDNLFYKRFKYQFYIDMIGGEKMSEKEREVVYFKEIKYKSDLGYSVYRYYIMRDQQRDEYYIIVDVENVSTDTGHCINCGAICLKIKQEEVEKVKELLERDVELFEEKYGEREWEDCDNNF